MLGQTCSEGTGSCDTACDVEGDADGDGFDSMACGGDDCDDADPDRRPGGIEICDVAIHDEDCDVLTFGVRDADGDDEPDARCCNVADDATTSHGGTDCDDTRAGVNPTAPEVCNGRDGDCDASSDETVLITYYVDGDMDGHGTSDPLVPAITACTPRPGSATTNNDCLRNALGEDGDRRRRRGRRRGSARADRDELTGERSVRLQVFTPDRWSRLHGSRARAAGRGPLKNRTYRI